MMRKTQRITGFLIISLGLVGGGCGKNFSEISQPVSSTTMPSVNTDTTSESVLPAVSATSTVISLVDRPIAEWPRYEFKELGFSMQLPFKNLEIRGGLMDCTRPEGRCDIPSSHSYVLNLGADYLSNLSIFVFAKTPDFLFDGYPTPFSTSSLVKNATGIYRFKYLKLLQTFMRNGRTLSLYEGGTQFFYEWEEEFPRLETILVPLKNSVFPAAAIILDEKQISTALITKIFRSISFLP